MSDGKHFAEEIIDRLLTDVTSTTTGMAMLNYRMDYSGMQFNWKKVDFVYQGQSHN
jgi:hypothetical protein